MRQEPFSVADLIHQWVETETWRQIAGWPGYEVSSFGNVRSRFRVLTPSLVHGYQIVCLSHGEAKQSRRVHILVADAFLGERPFVEAIVAHNDGIKTNCRVDNLRWASARENQEDCARHLTRCKGSRVHGAKLKEADIPVIRQRLAAGLSYPEIAEEFGVSKHTIYLIRHNRIWRSAGGAAWAIPE